jgi:hypothetical protein
LSSCSFLHQYHHPSMSQQQQQQQGTGGSTTLFDLDDFVFDETEEQTTSPRQQGQQPHPRYDGDITYKDQIREARLPSSSLGTAATGATAASRGGERAFATSIADDIPIVSAVAVSESGARGSSTRCRTTRGRGRSSAAVGRGGATDSRGRTKGGRGGAT